ncbi:hypothetical protein IEQ44_07960 [Nocardioides sp. Y6]|uniref:Uncharacterized protein n=1 Tax=Nocardioides malaquae TaxID=2773426 RepID=A0ABR9RSP0_9ACTN|nr:hypothetical protein [Nocardioides malaquae]MBE7324584.1 hypothetical protein [Nocardioides malaquae]
MPKFFGFGVSAPPTVRERVALEGRAARLEMAAPSVRVANDGFKTMQQTLGVQAFRLRSGYVFGERGASSGVSDLRQPPSAECPPAGSLVRSRGGLLRFHLLALAEAQFRVREGARASSNDRPLVPVSSGDTGWTDLFASDARTTTDKRLYVRAQDKRLRAIKQALDSLEASRLVVLPNRGRGAGKHEGFLLTDETASRLPDAEPLPYRVPRRDASFSLPMSFITNGWVHLLEDTEIAVLLMVACGRGSIASGAVAIPSDVRVLNYGIGRDRFESHRWLERFGLITVEGVDRDIDGKAIDFETKGASLHRLRLRREAFDTDGLTVVSGALKTRLAR